MNSIMKYINNCDEFKYLLEFLSISEKRLQIKSYIQHIYNDLSIENNTGLLMMENYIQELLLFNYSEYTYSKQINYKLKKITDKIVWSYYFNKKISDNQLLYFYGKFKDFLNKLTENNKYYNHITNMILENENQDSIISYMNSKKDIDVSIYYNAILYQSYSLENVLLYVCQHPSFIDPFLENTPKEYIDEFVNIINRIIEQAYIELHKKVIGKNIRILKIFDEYINVPLSIKKSIQDILKKALQTSAIVVDNKDIMTLESNLKNASMTMAQRDIIRLFVYENFDSSFENIENCFSNNNFIFLQKLLIESLLSGSNVYGDVYKVCYPLSKNKVKWKEFCETHSYIKLIIKLQSVNESLNEEYFLCLLSKMVRNKEWFNFPAFYRRFTCNDCHGSKVPKKCSVILSEFYEGGTLRTLLLDLVKNNVKNAHSILLSVIMQCLFSIYIMAINGIFHNDLHWDNILIKKINKGGVFNYIINNKHYTVPNFGYVAIIWDFGLSIHYDLSTNKIIYGAKRITRNIEMKQVTPMNIFVHTLNILIRYTVYWFHEELSNYYLQQILLNETPMKVIQFIRGGTNIKLNDIKWTTNTLMLFKKLNKMLSDKMNQNKKMFYRDLINEFIQYNDSENKNISDISNILERWFKLMNAIIPDRNITKELTDQTTEIFIDKLYNIFKNKWKKTDNIVATTRCIKMESKVINSCLEMYRKK